MTSSISSSVETAGPKRIQRRRTRGWRSPEGAVYVGRPSRLGNPWIVLETGDGWAVAWRPAYRYPGDEPALEDQWIRCASRTEAHERAVELYGVYVRRYPHLMALAVELAGRDLVCWCPPILACHVDPLLVISNSPLTEETTK